MDFLLQNSAIFLGLIIFACFSWRKIEYGIYAIVFCLPLYLTRLSVFDIPSTALELGIYALFIIWLVGSYYNSLNHKRPYFCHCEEQSDEAIPRECAIFRHSPEIPLRPLADRNDKESFQKQSFNIIWREIIPDRLLRIGIFFLLVGAIISTIFSSDLKTSAGILKGWFFDPFLFFIVLVSEIKTFKQKENVLKALFFSGLAVAAISLLHWLGFLSDGVSFDSRLYSFYLSPNYLAMYLSPALIIGVWLFYLSLRGGAIATTKQSRGFQHKYWIATSLFWFDFAIISKYLYLIALLIISAALYFTYSYAAWLAIILAIIILFYLLVDTGKKPSFHWKLGFLSFFLILAVLFFSQNKTAKFENLTNLSYRSSFNSRLMIWRSAWEIGKDNWLVGIGPGNFQKYYLDYQPKFSEPYLEWAVPQPHNIFLAFWLETGILGLLGFLMILIWFFRRCFVLLNLSLRNFNIDVFVIARSRSDEVMPPADPPKADNPEVVALSARLPRPEYRARNDRNSGRLNLSLRGAEATKQSSDYLLTVVLFSLMIYTLTHGLFDTTYWKNDLAVIFWLNLFLLK